jgi:hypothetical protein
MPPRTPSWNIFWIPIVLIAILIACQTAGPSSPIESLKELEIAQASAPIVTKATVPVNGQAPGLLSEAEKNQTNTAGSLSMAGTSCLATTGSGVLCLDQSGWNTYIPENSDLPANTISDLALCPDGSLLAAHSSGLSQFDGQGWKSFEPASPNIPDVVACDATGGIWTGNFQGVSHFDGQSWTDFPSSQLATASTANELVEDLAIGPDGSVWIATANSLAVYDGQAWQVFQERQGFDQQYFFQKIAVDAQGRIWAAHSSGLLSGADGQWQDIKNIDFISVSALALDAQGRPWVGTAAGGLWVLDGEKWIMYRQGEGELCSDSIQGLAIDERGRVWAGTAYGLSILEGERWQTYRMDNSGLGDNDIRAIVIQGKGPDLPAVVSKEPGSLSGRVVLADGQPLASAPVEICVETLGSMYFGHRPAQASLLSIKRTTTDGNGQFSYPRLPEGFYLITIQTSSGGP